MPRGSWVRDEVYEAGRRFADECLRSDGSVFTPSSAIWTPASLDDFHVRFVVNEKKEGGSFLERLEEQLKGAVDETIQLTAESLFVHYLCESDTKADTKRNAVAQILGWMARPVSIPLDLDRAFPSGLARIGVAKAQRWQQLRFLLEFVRNWKSLDTSRQEELLVDPWDFREFVHSLPKHSASVQIEGLLHLVYPEPFESIVSPNVKQKIAQAFADELDGTEENVDQKLRTIRLRLASEYGVEFSFYDPDLTAVWSVGGRLGDTHAWLVRGANVYSADLVPRWLSDGFVSMGREEDGEVTAGMTLDEVIDVFLRYHTDRTRESLRNEALSTIRFVGKMAVGDLMLTIGSDDLVYVGRVAGEHEWGPGDAPGTARRRPVEWLNADEPGRRRDLPERLRRLLRQNTVIDLSAVAEDVAALIPSRDGKAWEDFLHWGQRIYETEGFDETEREYKLEIAGNLMSARAALERNASDWLAQLRRAFGPPNNLTAWRAHDSFLRDLESDLEAASTFLREAWNADLEQEDVLTDLFDRWPADNSPGNRISLLSFLRMAGEPTDAPIYRATPVKRARGLLDAPEAASATPARRYIEFLALVDELRDRLVGRGAGLRDRLDSQSVLWWVAEGDPPATWSNDEQSEFLRWRGDLVDGDGESPLAAPVPQELADELLLDRRWLQSIIDLLNEKRQVIFYGPPGTGKTFVAQALAEHAVADGGVYELVQFHPAYSYEDFFEGYRPLLGATGGVEFELRPGPLRRLADQAREDPERVHLLVIDEINRGQIAKIFGELYFLLEYRDRAIRLQYSPASDFKLPDNLFVIGTMNTADRSIALVDSALRRRFYFIPFLPRDKPLRSLLRRWLDREGHPPDAADYLDLLNEALARAGEGDELAIGPSYFMTRDGQPDVERVWEYAIAPLLEERFYGARRPSEVHEQFSPAALRGSVLDDGAP